MQRGRDIGGLVIIEKGLFKPIIGTFAKAAKWSTGRAIGRALKDQAINKGTNLLADVVAGNDSKEELIENWGTSDKKLLRCSKFE